MADVLAATAPRRQPLSLLCRHAGERRPGGAEPDLSAPVDLSRFFICETLTPLYYTPIYRQLDEGQRRRYNQIAGMCQVEMTSFVEETFANSMLPALARARSHGLSPDLLACLEAFRGEESRHTEMFHRLKRLSSPRYSRQNYYILQIRRLPHAVLSWFTRHPVAFPFVIWLALILEECSIEVARRCGRMREGLLEPQYASVFRAHLADEIRHVQIDWHLVEVFYETRGPLLRRFNGALLRRILGTFFMWPKRVMFRLARLLVEDCPELAPVLPQIFVELGEFDRGTVSEMMFSRESHPITFWLFDRFPELRAMQDVIPLYRPVTSKRCLP